MKVDVDGDARAEIAILHVTSVVDYGLSLGLRQAGFTPARPTDVLGWALEAPGRLVVLPDTPTGLSLLEKLHAASDDLLSVALLQQASALSYRRALALCTSAVPLEAELDLIIEVVAAARNGRSLLPAMVTRKLAAGAPDGVAPTLSAHEVGWLRTLARGGTVAAIARTGGYSEREMYRRLGALYGQLGATTRTDAILRAERFGLLTGEAVSVPGQKGR